MEVLRQNYLFWRLVHYLVIEEKMRVIEISLTKNRYGWKKIKKETPLSSGSSGLISIGVNGLKKISKKQKNLFRRLSVS